MTRLPVSDEKVLMAVIGASLCSALASFDELLDSMSRHGRGVIGDGTRAAGVTPEWVCARRSR